MRVNQLRRITWAVVTLAIVTGLASVALGTPGSGIVSAAVWARAGFTDQVDVKIKVNGGRGGREVIHVPSAQETVIQQIVIGPGGQTGWHSHPGPVIVLIKAGELTVYSSDDPTCSPRTHRAGTAFVDSGQGHVHIAKNLSQNDNVELWATYLDVPAGGAFRIDAPSPGNCPF